MKVYKMGKKHKDVNLGMQSLELRKIRHEKKIERRMPILVLSKISLGYIYIGQLEMSTF